MIDTFIVEEMILQVKQNEVFRKKKLARLKIETSALKRDRLLEEVAHAHDTNNEIQEMLVAEYSEGISTRQLFNDINGLQF